MAGDQRVNMPSKYETAGDWLLHCGRDGRQRVSSFVVLRSFVMNM